MRLPSLYALLLSAPLCLAQAPTGLAVKLATSSQTQLGWTGTAANYTVQRAAVGAGFTNIATVTTTSYTDTTIDPYLQFTYQVIAGTTGTAVSNQVTVGPPPSGLSLAVTAPLIGNQVAQAFGQYVSMALDGNGDPALAYLFIDPNNNGDASQAQLQFRSWNRAQAQWNPIVTVATVGTPSNNSTAPVALAYDSSTGTFAIATEDVTLAIRLYVSTNGGSTWSLKTTWTQADGVAGPAMALGGGNIYLAFGVVGSKGLKYLTGKLSADPSTWTIKNPPAVKNIGDAYYGVTSAVAVDNFGTPAIAFWAPDTTQSYNAILLLWRPAGSSPPVAVTSTNNNQSDVLGVRMVFYKGNPRIGFAAFTGDSGAGTVHFIRSDDGGATWQKPVLMPPDGNAGTDYPLDIAVDSKGDGALAFNQRSSPGDGSVKCAVPKLATSADLLNWSTCQVAPNLQSFTGVSGAVQLAYGGNDKLLVLWQTLGDSQADSGVAFYRAPPDNQPTGPVISNVQDAESSRTTVVPGEWVALYGANFGSISRTWAGTDFNGSNLPTNLSGTSVTFNGLPGAIFYVSPTQIDAQVPAGLSGSVPVIVTNGGTPGAAFNVTVVPNAPSFYYYPGGSNLYPAAIHLDGTLIGDPAVTGSATRVRAGETIVLFVNGLAASPSGTIIAAPISYSGAITVNIGATAVTPAFAGLVAAGEYQLNLVVPAGLASGNYPMTVSTAGQTSTANIILPVQ